MSAIRCFSYPIDIDTPVYPGDMHVSARPVRMIKKGDACNTTLISLSSHAGTHMDAPNHFFERGKKVGQYDRDGLKFSRPCIIECPKKPDQAVTPEDVGRSVRTKNADILIFKTGFGKYRSKDDRIYRYGNPYLLPETAEYIVWNFPRLKAVGIDALSVSSKNSNIYGREVHRILLGKGIVIIEGIRIASGVKSIGEMAVFPVFSCSPDGSPCIVIGIEHD